MRAGTLSTLRRVVLPLIRPAIVAALGYSFISAMTSISAVIFLTSPRFDMATVNIVGRAEVGEYGYATAYASVLIVLMLAAVLLMRALVGRRAQRRLAAEPLRTMRAAWPSVSVESVIGAPDFADATAASAICSARRPSSSPIERRALLVDRANEVVELARVRLGVALDEEPQQRIPADAAPRRSARALSAGGCARSACPCRRTPRSAGRSRTPRESSS